MKQKKQETYTKCFIFPWLKYRIDLCFACESSIMHKHMQEHSKALGKHQYSTSRPLQLSHSIWTFQGVSSSTPLRIYTLLIYILFLYTAKAKYGFQWEKDYYLKVLNNTIQINICFLFVPEYKTRLRWHGLVVSFDSASFTIQCRLW